ncbi:MAG: hypothetical protein RL148_1173 [Planctomycetota bacterium]
MRTLPVLLATCLLGPAAAQEERPEPVAPAHRLAKETSPYLRLHAGNPVAWYPWGKEALERARTEDKPIFLSIGYASCHWCHVMERESFSEPGIAAFLNQHFVCIKVDREERPDLDEIHLAAVQAMTGQGGWPLSVWLTPELEPFFGGTYFPPVDRNGQPGFRRVAETLHKAWDEDRDAVRKGSRELAQHLQQVLAPRTEAGALGPELVDGAVAASLAQEDTVHGGFGAAPLFAPKFPHAAELQVLLAAGARGDAAAAATARRALDAMARGGIHDQVGGGFHRYTTDRAWLVPHFEKMLYDNAQLAELYLAAWQAGGERTDLEVARRALEWVLRDLRGPHGAFHSSMDAQSEGEEGRWFLWSKDEVAEVAGDDAAAFCLRHGVTKAGNFQGRNVLWQAQTLEALAAKTGRRPEDLEAAFARVRTQLLARRELRVRPAVDDKVLTAWNALAVGALARAHQATGEARWLEAARSAADFVLRELVVDGRCFRSWHSGAARHPGHLEDHALLADALLTLFESDFDPRWLRAASQLLEVVRARFLDPVDGGFFSTADDHERVLVRVKSPAESSVPAGAAVAAVAHLRLGLLLADEAVHAVGLRALQSNRSWVERAPTAVPSLVRALQFHLADPREVVVVGEPDDPVVQEMLAKARKTFPAPGVVLLVHDGNRTALEELTPLVRGKWVVDGKPAAHVCRRGVCEAPVTSAAEMRLR